MAKTKCTCGEKLPNMNQLKKHLKATGHEAPTWFTRLLGKQDADTMAHLRRPTQSNPDMEPDWTIGCENCGAVPVMPLTGMCGPCTFGEADTIGGNW